MRSSTILTTQASKPLHLCLPGQLCCSRVSAWSSRPPNALRNRLAAGYRRASCGLSKARYPAGGRKRTERASRAPPARMRPRAQEPQSQACPFLPPIQRLENRPSFPISQLFHCFLLPARPTVPQLSNHRD